MKNLRRIATAAIVSAAIVSSAFAQGGAPRPQGGGQGAPPSQAQMRSMMTQMEQRAAQARSRALASIKATPAETKAVNAAEEAATREGRAMMDRMIKKFMSDPKNPKQPTQADQKAMQAEGQKIRDRRNAAVKKALGKKYDAYMKALQTEMQKVMGAAPAPPRRTGS